MPARKSATSVLATARMFIAEAEPRQEQFVHFGLPPTFISGFKTRVDELERAINAQLNSRSGRRQAQAGIETTLVAGFEVIRNLDVTVANVLRDDPTALGGWRGARRIEGLTRGATRPVPIPVPPTQEAPVAAAPDDQEQVPPVRKAS
jgi:hypothetical protein